MRGCLEELLINKRILEEVTENCCSLITVWLDYQKAFDSVQRKWLIKALELAKVPEKIITANKTLMKKLSTNVNIQSGATSIESQPIQYLRRIFQGDSLSVLLFSFHSFCESVIIFIKQVAGLSHWQKWE